MSTSISPIHSSPFPEPSIYNRTFWIAYLANVAVVSGNALTFRFAEFVNYLGGSEEIAGQIISLAVLMSLGGRLFLGQAIDRFGVRKVWTMMTLIFICGSSLIWCSSELNWMVYMGRGVFALGLSGMLTCSVFHIQSLAPDHRRTEMIGSLGSSGFVGMILGSQLGDLILTSVPDGALQFQILFAGPLMLGIFYMGLVYLLTRNCKSKKTEHVPLKLSKLIEQWPGWILLVAWTMGVCFTVISVFLTRYATHLGLKGIGTFFTSYAVSALIIRILSRHWSKTIGRHRMVVLGLSAHGIGYAILPFVTQEWHFIIPALFSGFGHAILFPAVVSLGTGSFQKEWRGLGTNVVLGCFDLGTVTSAPVLGYIIDASGSTGFEFMFYTCSLTTFGTAILYQLTAARKPDEDLQFGKVFQEPETTTENPIPVEPKEAEAVA